MWLGARCGMAGPSLDEALSCRLDSVTDINGPSWKWEDRRFESGDVGGESTGEGSTDVAGELGKALEPSESSVEPTEDGEASWMSGALKESMFVVDSSCTGAEICDRRSGFAC